jgi:hypothetical protein
MSRAGRADAERPRGLESSNTAGHRGQHPKPMPIRVTARFGQACPVELLLLVCNPICRAFLAEARSLLCRKCRGPAQADEPVPSWSSGPRGYQTCGPEAAATSPAATSPAATRPAGLRQALGWRGMPWWHARPDPTPGCRRSAAEVMKFTNSDFGHKTSHSRFDEIYFIKDSFNRPSARPNCGDIFNKACLALPARSPGPSRLR